MTSGFFAILDDIATLMDDVAVASKIATRKTAGILGDDLAVNAEKATGFLEARELPVLWAITKGSFINKLIIIPIALLLNFFFPAAIKIILIVGAFYLAYEGAEKIVHYLLHRKQTPQTNKIIRENNPEAEKTKIKSAIATDFILSLEIVIITLGSVMEESLTVQILTTAVVAVLATVGVYGIVALIVRMDDAGFKLIKRSGEKGFLSVLGNALVKLLPWIIRLLTIAGTLALLLVSGGIFAHNISFMHHVLESLPTLLREFIFGLTAGIVVVVIVMLVKKIFIKADKQPIE